MKAKDIMVAPVITAKPYFTVQHVAKLFAEHRISAVPVVDDNNQLVGIVSEGDLLHRAENQTERPSPWWLTLFADEQVLAQRYVKERGRKISDVMTGKVITATPDTSLKEIALLLERKGIKRVPIVHDTTIVGIVSRANLIQALASAGKGLEVQPTDQQLREQILAHLKQQPWAHANLINVTVTDGIVDLWGLGGSDSQKQALRVAAESFHGVRAVNDNTFGRVYDFA